MNNEVVNTNDDDEDLTVEPKNEYEREINACLAGFLKKMSESTSIDSEYDLIKEVLNEENNRRLSGGHSSSWKPSIQKYPDAIVKLEENDLLVFAADVGDYVIIEFPNDWQESAYGKVEHIDNESGNFRIWNVRKKYYTHSNYKTALNAGQIIKLAPSSIRSLKNKKKNSFVTIKENEEEISSFDNENVITVHTKKRGRKKGSKNRSKEEIQTNKLEQEKQKKFRKAKKELRSQIQEIKNKHV